MPSLSSRISLRGIRATCYLLDTFELARLPPLHTDPFDRMLVCQAIANQMAILTPDPQIAQYPIGVQW